MTQDSYVNLPIRPHPEYSTIVPPLKPEEYETLSDSIRRNNGNWDAVVVNKEGFILDGNHRYKICNELGIEPNYEVKEFNSALEEKLFVIDSNLARRQLTDYARTELILLKKQTYLDLGKKNMSEAGKAGVAIRDSNNIADNEEGFINIDKAFDTRTDSGYAADEQISINTINTQKELADEAGVSTGFLYEVEYLTKHATQEQKQELREGKAKSHSIFRDIRQQEKLGILDKKIEQGTALNDLEMASSLNISIRPYDVWNYSEIDERFGQRYPGNIPAGIVVNTLVFFTEPGDLVLDPMAGGGVVGDVCRRFGRKCLMYDINPVREDIIKHDLKQGIPKGAKNADFVFWDPPYYKIKEQEYGPQSISALPKSEYMKVFEDAAECFAENGIKKIALLMPDYYGKNPDENIFIDEYIAQFKKYGEWRILRRVHCPLATQQITAYTIATRLKTKTLSWLARDLIIFERVNEYYNESEMPRTGALAL